MKPRISPPRPRRRAGKAFAGAALPAALFILGYRMLSAARRQPLPAAVSGERRELSSRAGRLSYYEAGGDGPPLLLVHSVNAAGSAYEVRPLYERYKTARKVYALELPGFGFSERRAHVYTPRLMTDAILAMVEEIGRRAATSAPPPIDALALSLSAEFLARAATEMPAAFRSLALVSPTGFDARASRREARAGGPGMPLLRDALSFPLWSRSLYDLLVSRASIRYFLGRTWGSPAIDEGLLEYDYLTTHQPGAQHAPYSFVSGLLFSADIVQIYDALTVPVWLTQSVRGDFVDYSRASGFAGRPGWIVETFQTGALPHFEQPDEFIRRYDGFLAAAASPAAA
jgi:alpha-beta hydrolase superfamily lysophospholipase